jgi:hypothetical protein
MIYFNENNWVTWSYNDQPIQGRSSSASDIFKVHHNPDPKPIGTFLEEGIRAAKSVANHYQGRQLDLFFSGGLDSEIMVRSFYAAGLKPRVHIVRYENDINLEDVSYAIAIANSLNIDYNIIDMNIKKFFENDAERIAEQAQMDRPRMLPSLIYGDLVDGVSILAMGEALWQRTDSDYSKKGTWQYWEIESDYACDKYNLFHGRESIHLWHRWTPELVLAHTKYKWFYKLINDGYPKRLGNTSTKIIGFKEEFPDLLERKKYTGFERISDLIIDFENFLKKKNNGLIHRRQVEYSVDEYITKLTTTK